MLSEAPLWLLHWEQPDLRQGAEVGDYVISRKEKMVAGEGSR